MCYCVKVARTGKLQYIKMLFWSLATHKSIYLYNIKTQYILYLFYPLNNTDSTKKIPVDVSESQCPPNFLFGLTT